jgi:nuclear pore complex protein Nup214
LIEASKEAREKGKASTRCAQDCCLADVPLPGVSLLALSRDESVLAACAGSEIKFFSVTSLLTDKVGSSLHQFPANSCEQYLSVEGSVCIFTALRDTRCLSKNRLVVMC